jgi:hypothetical protein
MEDDKYEEIADLSITLLKKECPCSSSVEMKEKNSTRKRFQSMVTGIRVDTG